VAIPRQFTLRLFQGKALRKADCCNLDRHGPEGCTESSIALNSILARLLAVLTDRKDTPYSS
jgi:hypothetical protein